MQIPSLRVSFEGTKIQFHSVTMFLFAPLILVISVYREEDRIGSWEEDKKMSKPFIVCPYNCTSSCVFYCSSSPLYANIHVNY